MLRIETLSVFPEMFDAVMSTSILGRARAMGALEFAAHDLRNWTHDRHRSTDDEPYGGGPGQLMKAQPIFEALDELLVGHGHKSIGNTEGTVPFVFPVPPLLSPKVIFFTPHGQPFNQALAQQLAGEEHLIMVCGRYEGLDERVYVRADYCISLGDYILTGGELAAMVVSDAVCRLLPGVLGDEQSNVDESFSQGLLEYPQYTRPASYRGMDVPEVLLSGNHAVIAQWRRKMSIIKTARHRPDLLAQSGLEAEEIEQILNEEKQEPK